MTKIVFDTAQVHRLPFPSGEFETVGMARVGYTFDGRYLRLGIDEDWVFSEKGINDLIDFLQAAKEHLQK